MAITFQPSAYSGLVDQDNGMVSREIFVNADIYAEEQERIFTRAWLFVGHESQVAKPGDFFVSSMGEESVILCRDRQGEIHVFLNSCMHRGMKVCRYDEGNTPIFTCPYHGWSFATDGALVGVPFYKDAYHEELDKSQWSLIRVPRMVNYKGGIWATWDPHAPDFLDYIGGFKTYLDILFDGWDGSEGGTEIIGGIEKWMVPSNWKFPAENFIGDRYHNISHRSVDLVGIGPSGQGRRDNSEREGAKSLDVSFPERGHGTVMFLRPEDAQPVASYQNDPVVSEYFYQCEIARKERQGQLWRILAGPGTIFPNMSFLPRQPRSIAVWHPRGPDQTEVWRWFLVDSSAPPEVKEFLRQYYIRYSGPAGLTEQDDMENWNYAHAASRGAMARRHHYNYQMGMGYAVTDFEDGGLKLDGTVLDTTKARAGEQNQRGFYSRWREFMAARDWTNSPPGATDRPVRWHDGSRQRPPGNAVAQTGRGSVPVPRGEPAGRPPVRGVAGPAQRRRALLGAHAPQRQVRRAGARVHPRRPGHQLVRRGQGHADAAGQADPHRRPLGRGTVVPPLPPGDQRGGAGRIADAGGR